MKEIKTVRQLLIDHMQDIYDAEKQLVKALPKMVKTASNSDLREAFESHLEQTRGHVERLERAFEMLDFKAKSKPCEAMKGLVKEAGETIEESLATPLLDSAIICAAQKVEHYEIAGYGTLVAWANSIGLDDVAKVFEETLREEKEADEKLTQVAGEILAQAAGTEGQESEMDGEELATSGRKSAATRSEPQRKNNRHAS